MGNDNFARLLENTSEEHIGVGNPDAKILIIANEPGIDKDNKEQSNKEVARNRKMWQAVDSGDFQTKYSVEDHPRFPYKGQLYTVYSPENGRGEGGTSRTWYNYQKLIDCLRGVERGKRTPLDFHDFCFSTDFSSVCAKKSGEIDKYQELCEEREKSIVRRAGSDNNFFSEDFFQQFPIVIVASGHYIKQFKHIFNPKDLFGFEDYRSHDVEDAKGKKIGWINIHECGGESPKLLLHTKHFSSSISDKYIAAIANEIITFVGKYNITLF
jgi:hypothetical protein